jgi:hypothetical protein
MAFWEHAIVPEIAENIKKHAQTCIRMTYFLKTKRLPIKLFNKQHSMHGQSPFLPLSTKRPQI